MAAPRIAAFRSPERGFRAQASSARLSCRLYLTSAVIHFHKATMPTISVSCRSDADAASQPRCST